MQDSRETSSPRSRRGALSKTSAPAKASANSHAGEPVTSERRQQLIEHAAYLRAERRGFQPGGELADWIEAEREIDAALAAESPRV